MAQTRDRPPPDPSRGSGSSEAADEQARDDWTPESPDTWGKEADEAPDWHPEDPTSWSGPEDPTSWIGPPGMVDDPQLRVGDDDGVTVTEAPPAKPAGGTRPTHPLSRAGAHERYRSSTRSRSRSHSKGRRKRHRRPRWLRWTLIVGGVVLVASGAIIADAYYQAYRVASPLEKISGNLNKARTALSRGKLPSGDPLAAAVDLADQAERDLRNSRFTFGLVGRIPLLNRPIEVVRHQVVAAREWSASATEVKGMLSDLLGSRALRVRDLQELEHDEDEPPVLEGGNVNVDLVASLTPRLDRVIAHLEAADRAIRDMPDLPFISRLANLKEKALVESTRSLEAARNARAGISLMPAFLGAGEPKRYYIAVQNTADQRGSGGAVLAYALLLVDEGELILEQAGPIGQIDPRETGVRGVPLPEGVEWYIRTAQVNPRLANGANYSGDFPMVATAWADMVEEVIDRPIDGVIAIDPYAIAYALGSNTQIRVPSYPDPIDGDNAVFVITNDQYRLEKDAQQAFPGELITEAWPRLREPRPFVRKVQRLGDAMDEKHIQVWLREPELQDLIVGLGWDGALEANPGDYLFLAHNKRNGNKVDYYLEQDIVYDVVVQPNGDVSSTYSVTLTGDLPPDEPAPISGREGYGLNVAMENLYVPERAVFESVAPEGEVVYDTSPRGFVAHVENDFRVFTKTVEVRPGDPKTITFTYDVPDVIEVTDEGNVYQLTIQHQTMENPADITVRVTLPEGGQAGPAEGWTVDGNVATFETVLDRDLVTRLVF